MLEPRPRASGAAAPALPAAQQLQLARRRFFDQGADPGALVPESIVRSWRRCARLPAGEAPGAEPLPGAALDARREAQGRLRRHALPELEALAEALAPTRAMVLLADPEGLVLDAAGSDSFMTKAQRVALMPGIDWSERSRGTNAIGTALSEGHALSVVGPQHYLEQNAALACTATPLLGPDGRLLGVLDVSGDLRCIHEQTASLVRVTGQTIEHRLALDEGPAGSELLRFAPDPALLGSHREALLWLRDGAVVGANRAALRLLGMRFEQVVTRRVADLFAALPPAGRGPACLQLRHHLLQPGRHAQWAAAWVPGASHASTPPCRQTPPPRGFADMAQGSLVDDAAQRLRLERATRVLAAGIPVLVQGESGTGKEVFARRLHAACARATGPFVAVNCAALPEALIESELFGYEAGAFTGAHRQGRPGLIREAEGGVLFLDEIGDMPLALQARLLRVLQEREVRSLGSARARSVDFALVCATHRDLRAMVDAGRFRADLYYRLQHFIVALPSLRDDPRRHAHVHDMLERTLQDRGIELSPRAREALQGYSWPGNWRELAGTCRTLEALASAGLRVELEDLPAPVREAYADAAGDRGATSLGPGQRVARLPAGGQARQAGQTGGPTQPAPDLRSLTAAAMQRALDACGGNVSRAARMLGVHRSTLYRHHAAAARER
jgi:transcriptional regulator of acetoin/glycerol metabolism